MTTFLNHDTLELAYELEQGGTLACEQELDDKLGLVCGLEQGGKLELVYGLEQHDNHLLLGQVDMERHVLHKIRQQHIQCNDPRCILHFGVFHQEEERYNDHKQHFHLNFRLLQCWFLCIHL